MNGGKFLFTVEQLELIRRLRNSGLTKQQVLSAFDSFERLDHQLGDVYNIPLSLVSFVDLFSVDVLRLTGLHTSNRMRNIYMVNFTSTAVDFFHYLRASVFFNQ